MIILSTYYVDLENYESFKSFGFLYIYIYIHTYILQNFYHYILPNVLEVFTKPNK